MSDASLTILTVFPLAGPEYSLFFVWNNMHREKPQS